MENPLAIKSEQCITLKVTRLNMTVTIHQRYKLRKYLNYQRISN